MFLLLAAVILISVSATCVSDSAPPAESFEVSELSAESIEASETSSESFEASETSSEDIESSEVVPDESSEEPAEPSESQPGKEDPDEWQLVIVNRDNPVPEGYEPVLAETERGHKVDHRIACALAAMLADARADGIMPRITSAYRTADDQIREMNEYVERFIGQGYTPEQAAEEARKWVAPPGSSEHQLGLAVDISTANWAKQHPKAVWNWLGENCWKYGFIQHYTKRCREYTGASVEPWHFRYVGVEYAKDITDSGLCFEEWLEARAGTE